MAKLATLVDGFATVDSGVWSTLNGTITTESGGVKMTYPAGAYNTATIQSVSAFDFSDSSITMEVPWLGTRPLNNWVARIIITQTDDPTNDFLRFGYTDPTDSGTVMQATNNGGQNVYAANGTYDPIACRFMRIRETSGTVYYEVSPDYSHWTTQGSFATSGLGWTNITSVKATIELQRGPTAAGAPSYAILDNVNQGHQVTPYVVAASSAAVTTSRSPALTFTNYYPTVGDVVAFWAASTVSSAGATAPSGWVLPTPTTGSNPASSDSHTQAFTYHLVTSGDAADQDGTVTFTATNLWNSTQTGNVLGCVIRGGNPSSVIDSLASSEDSGNSVTPHVFPALSGSDLSTDSLVLGAVAKGGTGTYTTPVGWMAYTSNSTNMGHALMAREAPTVAATNVSATNVTPSAGDEYCAFTVAFTKASTAPTTYRWNGSAWVAAPTYRWDGASWNLTPVPA